MRRRSPGRGPGVQEAPGPSGLPRTCRALGRAGGVSSRPIERPPNPRGGGGGRAWRGALRDSPGGEGGRQEQEGLAGARTQAEARPRAQPPAGSKSARGKKTGWGREAAPHVPLRPTPWGRGCSCRWGPSSALPPPSPPPRRRLSQAMHSDSLLRAQPTARSPVRSPSFAGGASDPDKKNVTVMALELASPGDGAVLGPTQRAWLGLLAQHRGECVRGHRAPGRPRCRAFFSCCPWSPEVPSRLMLLASVCEPLLIQSDKGWPV